MDRDWNGITFGMDEAKSMQDYLDFVRERVAVLSRKFKCQALLHVEFDLARPEIHPLFYGRLDVGITADSYAEIIDYKHGEGITVEACENPQLRYYAAGFVYDMHEITHVGMWIMQPRAFHPSGPTRFYDEPVTKLMSWLQNTLVPAMLEADPTSGNYDANGDDVRRLVPGDSYCRFCPAVLACPARKQELAVIENVGLMDVARATHEELGELLEKVPRATMVIKALKEEGLRRMQDGIDIPGQKMVAVAAHRKWKAGAENAVAAAYGLTAYERKLKSPAKIEELIGGEAVTKEHAYSPDGGYTIAPQNDKRRAVQVKRLSENYPVPVGEQK